MIIPDILRHSAQLYPNKTAVIFESHALTYREFTEYCSKMGAALHGLGLQRGERIAFLSLNSLELAAAHFAVPGCGMVVLPLNHRLSKQEILEILEDAKAAALVYSPEFAAVVDGIRPRLGFVKCVICTEAGRNDPDLQALLQSAMPMDFEEPIADELATLLYTSGTTGKPKGVQLSHANTASTLATLLIEERLVPDDIGLMVAPLFHVAGCHTFMALVARGCTVHLLPGFDPRKTLEALAENRATVTLLVPAMIGAILRLPDQDSFDTRALRLLVYAGAPMPETLLQTAIARFGNIFFQIYGLTETSVLSCLRVEDHRQHELLSSAGREMYGCHLRLVDDRGEDVPPGYIGYIIAKGDNVTSGYWNAPQETARSLQGGWFETGDVAVKNEEGYLFLKDRKKDMIVTGGENVYPVEVENVLNKHPSINETAVIGIPDEEWGERVIALVNLKEGIDIGAKEVIEFCREHLASYKCPKEVKFCAALPRTASGKIKKNILRAPYWEGATRGVH